MTRVATSATLRLETGGRFRERYEIRRKLGEGGMGIVYEAFDHVRQARVALKTMRHLDAGALYRFKNEFRALTDVSHPNLASLHELEADGPQPFFTMEYVEGGDFLAYVADDTTAISIASTIRAHGSEKVSAAVEDGAEHAGLRSSVASDVVRLRAALAQLVEGVAALHACGKLHRDLKPSNVLVTPEGRVVVLDFGLVSSLVSQEMQTVEHNVVGTPEYMSPEQGASSELTEASDWYSVGVMLYQALTGALPFRGPPLKIIVDKQQIEPARPGHVVEGIPEDLDLLCVDLLRRDPSLRPTAASLLARLGSSNGERRPSRQSMHAMPSMEAVFVARERHVVELGAAFDATRAGRTVVAYVRGSSGMGKSLLVQRWLDSVRQKAVVLSGRCYERESVPYKALDSIVDALSRYLRQVPRDEVDAILPVEIHALTRLFPVLDRVEAFSAAPRRAHEVLDPQEIRRRAAMALRELIERMAARRPLVLWIDDLQWGDVDSAALVHELLRPPDSPAMLLVVSYRAEDADAPLVAALRARDDQDVDVREIEVGALDRAEAHELALALLREDSAKTRAQAMVIADESQGNPLFVDELARHISAGQTPDWTAGSALRLDDVLFLRVCRLPDDARRLLEVIAVAGHPLSVAVATTAAQLDGGRETMALALLRAGRLVRSLRTGDSYDIETYHDRIRETIVARLDAGSRTAMHLRIGRALVARGDADPEELSVHFLEGGDRRKGAELAAAAATKAADTLAFDRAAMLWRRAIELPEISPDSARSFHWRLGEALANAGRGVEAAEAYLAAVPGASAGDGLELRRRVAEQLLRCGRIVEGTRALEDVLAAVEMRIPSSIFVTFVLIIFYEVWLRLRGLRFRERDLSEVSAAELTRVDILWSVGALLGIVRPFPAQVFQKKHLLLALRTGERARILRSMVYEASSSATRGIPAKKRTTALLQACQDLSRSTSDQDAPAWIMCSVGLCAYFEGRFLEARIGCDAAVEVWRDCAGSAWEIAIATTFSFYALFQLGQMAELSRRLPAYTQEARQRGDVYALTNGRLSLSNAVWLAADDPERAERELDDALSQWGSPELQVQQHHDLLARVQIELYRGKGLGSLALIERRKHAFRRAQLHYIQIVRVEDLHLHARAAIAAITAGEVASAAAEQLSHEALRDARRIRAERLRWATPLACLIEAAVHTRQGDIRRALALLASAIDDFDASDMALWSAAARRRRGVLLSGEQGRVLVEQADAEFRGQAVRVPEKYAAMLAPGFPAAP